MTPRRSLRNQKRQTTLQFSPLSSSSPAKKDYSPAVQNRLASVRFNGASSSPQKQGGRSREAGPLPTPEPSSQSHVPDEAFNNLTRDVPSSPPRPREQDNNVEEETDEDDLILSPQKKRKLSSNKALAQPVSSPAQRRSTRSQPTSSSHLQKLSLDSSEEDTTKPPSRPSTRRSGRLRRGSLQGSMRSESSHTNVPIEVPALSHQLSGLGSAETSDEEDVVMASRPVIRRKSKVAAEDPFVVDDDIVQYVSEDEIRHRVTPRRRNDKADDFLVDDDQVEYISSDDDEIQNSRKNTKSRKSSATHSNPKTSRRRTQEEQDELEEDLQDLRDSEAEASATKTRTRGGPVSTQRDKAREHFELLKRRRAGEKVPRIEDSEDEETEASEGVDINLIGAPYYNMSREGSVASTDDAEQESDPEPVDQDEEDDFVIEDSHGRLGRPHPDIPLRFTSFASAKPRELFPHIIEWLVKNKLAPAFNRDDELYNLAFDRVDDQVKAQAGSRLISAAWGTTFKRAILARPNMKVVRLPGEDIDNIRDCDACNRSNHPARFEFVFSGEPYFQKTLEPVDNSDEEDEYEDDASRDENGHVLASQNQRFYLGRFCAANAEMGHKLTHWKHHLNQALISYLEEQGVLSAESIVAREKTNKKKREKEAEHIVDTMQETGVIADFWADFENDLNDARLGMEDYEKKGGRSKGRVGAVRSTFVRD